jgi:hypothetical protein
MTDPYFTGKDSIGRFLKTIMQNMVDQDCNCAELQMEFDGHLIDFNVEVVSVTKLNTEGEHS